MAENELESPATIETTSETVQNFHEYFLTEPVPQEGMAEQAVPVAPSVTIVTSDSRMNYSTLQWNMGKNYGCTALMSMIAWQSACYGRVEPGTVFLFPGTTVTNAPPYSSTCQINCTTHAALSTDSGALHQQMCDLLGQPSTTFIGFSVTFPWNSALGVGYNSGICNPYWFDSRTIPTDYNGVNWQQIVHNSLYQLTEAFGAAVSGKAKMPKQDHRSGPNFKFIQPSPTSGLMAATLTSPSGSGGITAKLYRDKSFGDEFIADIADGSTFNASLINSDDDYYISDPSGAANNFTVMFSAYSS